MMMGNRNGKKNNCRDILSEKLARFTWEDMDMTPKGKSPDRKWSSSNSSIKQIAQSAGAVEYTDYTSVER